MIQGIKDKVVVKDVQPEEVTEGGIIIPENANKLDPQVTCVVISFGEEVNTLKVGDTIYCHRNAGMAMMIRRETFRVLKYDEIYAVLK